MGFIIIKKNFNDSEMLINILRNLLGINIKVDDNDDLLIIHHNYSSDEDIIKVLNSLSDDMMVNLVSYVSMNSSDSKLEEELNVIIPIFKNNNLPSGVYKLKELLLKKPVIPNKRQLLNYILESTGVDEEFIRDFALNDLNVSKASKAMYIHRNTMIYKLDKLKEVSNFDLRCFIDAYILYNLIEN
ncbi:MAG: helix-turn-helix domain-containing protein [Acholeplasmatales bacterium]|nr:helix-turn-helix domain-containing protein [Acholeplasmatales bacterium]